LGKFRVVPEDDLARFGYQGNYTQMASDIRRLTRQGLVEQRTIEGHSSHSTKVLTLTRTAIGSLSVRNLSPVGRLPTMAL
jgi:hypothetical protein